MDDEPAFRISLADLLALDGHDVLTFASASELPPLGTLGRLDVVVTDYEMPDADGVSLADALHAHDPTLPVILVTAHHDRTVARLAAARAFLSLMEKPLRYEVLHTHIHERTRPRGARGR